MRVWEINDSKAIPTDLVREQDFILRVRRLQRIGTPHLAINLLLGNLPVLAEDAHIRAKTLELFTAFAGVTGATLSELSNGDIFLIWEELHDADLLVARIMDILPASTHAHANREGLLKTFHLPNDYAALRERANQYVEIVQSHASQQSSAASNLQSESARGPLTAWSVDQIGQLLHNIDLQKYVRRQPIYAHRKGQPAQALAWQPIAEEYYVSFEDLRVDRFPKLQIITPEHLFLALCESLDHNLLASLTADVTPILGQPLHLNVAVATVAGSVFIPFARAIPLQQRANLTFELHRGDLFQDFSLTLGAIQSLRQEGFKVALDAITPDLLRYIDLAAFDVDYIKINVSRERADDLAKPGIRDGLAKIPPEKLIFFRCDNEKSLAAGLDFGGNKVSGLVD